MPKKIEDIEVGDLVYAYDEETGESDRKPVVQLFRNKAKASSTLVFDVDGVESEPIVSTPGHKYYLPDNKVNRRPGSYEGLDDKYGIVKSVKTKECEEYTTYNFEVADFHIYYVGEQGILVHNAACDFKNYTPEQIANKYDITVEQFHKQVKPEMLRQVKLTYKVGNNPNIMLSKANQIAYQGAKGIGFQETGLNMLEILSKLNL